MPSKTYPNLYTAVQDPDLLKSNEWLHIDAAEWAAQSLHAPVYLFPEDEMEDLADDGQAQECQSGTLVPSAYAQRDMRTLCEVGSLQGVIFNLAKTCPRYTPEQLLHALNHYLAYDDFYDPGPVKLHLHLWASQAAPHDFHQLKDRKAALEKALGQPPGGIWVQRTHPQPISDFLNAQPLHARLHQPAELGAACAVARLGDVNAVYALAADARPDTGPDASPPPTVSGVLYLGCFEATFNPEG